MKEQDTQSVRLERLFRSQSQPMAGSSAPVSQDRERSIAGATALIRKA